MTKYPINEEWLISAALSARNAKTGLNAANGLQFRVQTIRHPGANEGTKP